MLYVLQLAIFLVATLVAFFDKSESNVGALDEELEASKNEIQKLNKDIELQNYKMKEVSELTLQRDAEREKVLEKYSLDLLDKDAKISSLEKAVEKAVESEKTMKDELVSKARNDSSIVDFMELLQRKSRIVDFSMGDISSIDDETVGRASRVVHQGLSDVFKSFISVSPVRSESEGEGISISADDNADLYTS